MPGWWAGMGQSKRRFESKLDAILAALGVVLQKEEKLMALIDDLLVDVQDESTVVGSVETLLTNLSQMLAAALAAGTATPAQLQAIKAVVDTNKARLSAAVVANTPAAPTP